MVQIPESAATPLPSAEIKPPVMGGVGRLEGVSMLSPHQGLETIANSGKQGDPLIIDDKGTVKWVPPQQEVPQPNASLETNQPISPTPESGVQPDQPNPQPDKAASEKTPTGQAQLQNEAKKGGTADERTSGEATTEGTTTTTTPERAQK